MQNVKYIKISNTYIYIYIYIYNACFIYLNKDPLHMVTWYIIIWGRFVVKPLVFINSYLKTGDR